MNAKRQRTSGTSQLVTTTTRTGSGRRTKKSRIYKTLKYNGEVAFTRSCSAVINIVESVGFSIGGGSYAAMAMVFDPTGVTLFGSAVNFINIPLVNAAEISAMWDRLKIDKVEITFDNIAARATTGFTTSAPKYLISNDCNNGSTGTSVDAIKQHTTCTAKYGEGPHKWTVRPKHQRLVYYTPLTSSYEPASGFVNSDTAIPHYGTHLGIETPAVCLTTYLHLNFKFFLRCKDVK